jgi:hypothetical protein
MFLVDLSQPIFRETIGNPNQRRPKSAMDKSYLAID